MMPSRATRGKAETSVSSVSHAGRAQINPFGCGSDCIMDDCDLPPDRRISCVRADGGVLSGTD
jgi:hypothetical protein